MRHNQSLDTTDYSSLSFEKVFINSDDTRPLCHLWRYPEMKKYIDAMVIPIILIIVIGYLNEYPNTAFTWACYTATPFMFILPSYLSRRFIYAAIPNFYTAPIFVFIAMILFLIGTWTVTHLAQLATSDRTLLSMIGFSFPSIFSRGLWLPFLEEKVEQDAGDNAN